MKRSHSIIGFVLFASIGYTQGAIAQVIPDATVGTIVSPGPVFNITGGTRPSNGPNLFHSFSQFSLPTGSSAIFQNDPTVQTIFSRVTGGSRSDINGLIQTQGTASLFLMNPNGIVFGPNAQLQLGGSFVGTTANSIKFEDGIEFSAGNLAANPLLSVKVPIGLQMGTNAGPIQVQGSATINPSFRLPTLSVAPMQTLALVGGQIDLSSATVSAPGGRIELWSVQNAQISTNSQPWQLASPTTAANWGTITLQQTSLVDASGTTFGGGINVRGRGLTLQESSNIKSFTFSGEGQDITVNTTEFVDLLGATDSNFPFGFDGISTSVGNSFGIIALPGPPATGRAGNVTLETGRLQIANSATLRSATAGNHSSSGNVTVRATDVEMRGFETLPTLTATTIMSVIAAGNHNQTGQVTVSSDRIRLLGGSRIAGTVISGSGTAGDVVIRATESLEIRGTTFNGLSSAVLTTLEAGSSGQGGKIFIDTGLLTLSQGGAIASEVVGSQISPFFGVLPGAQGTAGSIHIQSNEVQVSDPIIDGFSQTLTGITTSLGKGAEGIGGNIYLTADRLHVFNGGQISASSQGQGAAGNVNLNVSTIDIQGGARSQINDQYLPSAITASASIAAAGSINITANSVAVRDTAQITVSNTGIGDAGNLNINARSISLQNGGILQATVNGGNQGNIKLQAKELLLLRQKSQIITSATGLSTGGNITIESPIILGLENSDIIANAFQGRGGNIEITTQGLIGLKYRPLLTPDNDITASSKFGINGNVQINTIGINPTNALNELPVDIIDSSRQIADRCAAAKTGSFVSTGKGGIPQSPMQTRKSDRTWQDLRDTRSDRSATTTVISPIAQSPAPIVEASAIQVDQSGAIALVAHPISVISPHFATCATHPAIGEF